MTEMIAPSDLYLKLQSALDDLRDVQRTVQQLTREYQSYDPRTLGVDTLGEPTTGPDATEALLRALANLKGSFTASEAFFDQALAYGSRLQVKD